MKQAFLRKGKEDSLNRFHPWIFSGAIHHFSEQPEEGEVVEVYASTPNENGKDWDFKYIATGHFQIGSIMIRILSFSGEEIDEDFYKRKIAVALDVRKAIGVCQETGGDKECQNNTFRLIHGEGDNLPGLVVDVYGKTAVLQAHSVGMHTDRMMVAKAIKEVMGDKIENIYYKSETTLPFKADLGQENGFLIGGDKDDIAVENGLRFHVDWLKGQKTGFFVDQRENRALLQKFAKDRKVLNMFCYTGGFSFYAMRGGANLVHSVDSSQKAIDLTNSNVELNFPGDPRHKAFAQDAFKFLDEMKKGEYDLIILDPPAFAKHKDAVKNAMKGYSRLNQKAFEKIQSGGILFTFSCSQVITKDAFRTAVFTAAAHARRNVRILYQLHQPADHPINIYHPEGEYLKGLVLYVE
jgi:23S rRNA (cytosine1962-C5)-methyltransferase